MPARKNSRAKVVSFIHMKGGVGKSTCAVNLAATLAKEHQRRVLVVDFDPQTNATTSLMPLEAWKQWSLKHGTMADLLEMDRGGSRTNSEYKIEDCIVRDAQEAIPGLDLIPSHLQLTFLDLDLAARPGRERIFARKLNKILGDYDFVFCDCAPNLMTATQNALFASDWYLTPMQPDFLSSMGLSMLRDRLSYLRKSLEFNLKSLGVVFSRVRGHLTYHQETMERLRTDKAFKSVHFFENWIPENIKLGEAPMESKPINIYDNRATGAVAFRKLTEEFLERIGG